MKTATKPYILIQDDLNELIGRKVEIGPVAEVLCAELAKMYESAQDQIRAVSPGLGEVWHLPHHDVKHLESKRDQLRKLMNLIGPILEPLKLCNQINQSYGKSS